MDDELQDLISQCTEKELRFVMYWFGDGGGKQLTSARLAGYSSPSKQGFQLANKPRIARILELKSKERLASLDITVDAVLAGIYREANLTDRKGGKSSTRIQAWIKLGEKLDMWSGKGGQVNLQVNLGSVPLPDYSTNVIQVNLPEEEEVPE